MCRISLLCTMRIVESGDALRIYECMSIFLLWCIHLVYIFLCAPGEIVLGLYSAN